MIEAVVFDLDGTLVRLPIDYESLFEEFRRIMRVADVRPLVDTISRMDGRTRELVFGAWEKAELAVLGKVVANDKGMKVYGEFAGKRRALVTLQGKVVVEAVLRRFEFAFDVVVTREDALFRAAQLSKAVNQLGVDVRNVLFVGNTEGDAVAAEKVGCQFFRVM